MANEKGVLGGQGRLRTGGLSPTKGALCQLSYLSKTPR